MELLYVYIKAYKSLNNLELNFGGKFRFRYDATLFNLQGWEDADYIHDYYPLMINNLSAIVGENGAGKSSVVEFLLEFLTEGNSIQNPEAVIIGREWANDTLTVYVHSKLSERISISCPVPYKLSSDLREAFNVGEMIYYTNSFYDRIDMYNIRGLLNISFKNMFFNAAGGSEFHIRNRDLKDGYSDFLFGEYWRILRFMQSGLKFNINFSLPKYLILSNISSKYQDPTASENLFKSVQSTYRSSKNAIDIAALYGEFSNLLFARPNPDFNSYETFIFNLETSLIFEMFSFEPEVLVAYLETDFKDSHLFDRDKVLFSIIKEKEYFDLIKRFFEETGRILKSAADNVNSESAWINTGRISEDELFAYFKLMKDLMYPYSSFLNIRFGFHKDKVDELSSGEMAILSLLSRFYSLSRREQIFQNLHVNRNAMILIDEGELYLHPSWQKKLVNILVNTLPQILDDARLQIILTSHSPFVLSDLPKSKVAFLVKQDRDARRSEILEHDQTLAANIHTLLSDAFFMDNGFIGDYAKHVIDNVIKDLNTTRKIDLNRREDIRRIIVAIGEPILRKRLNQMYSEKFNLDIDDRVSSLEKKWRND